MRLLLSTTQAAALKICFINRHLVCGLISTQVAYAGSKRATSGNLAHIVGEAMHLHPRLGTTLLCRDARVSMQEPAAGAGPGPVRQCSSSGSSPVRHRRRQRWRRADAEGARAQPGRGPEPGDYHPAAAPARHAGAACTVPSCESLVTSRDSAAHTLERVQCYSVTRPHKASRQFAAGRKESLL